MKDMLPWRGQPWKLAVLVAPLARVFQPEPKTERLCVLTILGLHAVLVVGLMRPNFVTVDEVGHIGSGLASLQLDSYSAYRVNPPLPRMVAALPVLMVHPRMQYGRLDTGHDQRPEWNLGRDLLAANREYYLDLVFLARLPGAAWSVIGAWLVFRWSRDLFGRSAGLLGLTLWCFNPSVLAFAGLATPDIPATVAGLGATYCFWRSLETPSWPRTILAGVLLGIAQLTKFTMLLLLAIWPVMELLVPKARERWFRQTGAAIVRFVSILIISIAVINVGYNFHGTGRSLGGYAFVSKLFSGDGAAATPARGRSDDENVQSGNRFRNTWLAHVRLPLPEDYLWGIDLQRRDFEAKLPSYLAGEWRDHGWWYYYLYALCIKQPIGILALVLTALAVQTLKPSVQTRTVEAWLPWVAGAALLAGVSSQTGFNHHLRYALPTLPFIFVGTSGLAASERQRDSRRTVTIAVLLAWSVASVPISYPHCLSYFNELAGGPEHGHDHLVDSNIDWGQDLLFLKSWLAEHPDARPLFLAYFNAVDPVDFGVSYEVPPPGPPPGGVPPGEDAARFGPWPGYHAISVNLLRGAIYPMPNGHGGWKQTTRHDDYAYFREFEPVARAGYSIYIYHISYDQAQKARKRLGLPPLAAAPARAQQAGARP